MEAGQKHMIPLVLAMIKSLGLELCQRILFELKFEKKPELKTEE